jgi:hypothetical protein
MERCHHKIAVKLEQIWDYQLREEEEEEYVHR